MAVFNWLLWKLLLYGGAAVVIGLINAWITNIDERDSAPSTAVNCAGVRHIFQTSLGRFCKIFFAVFLLLMELIFKNSD